MSIEDLPVPLMVDILSRLPVKTVIHCKCVCKKWLDLVSDSYFANLHMSRSPAIFMIHDYVGKDIWKWVEVEDELDNHHLHHDPIMTFDLDPITRRQGYISHVGSINGLICLEALQKVDDNTYICNPVTREYMILPGQQINGRKYAYCFGIGSLSQEYKVIRICSRTLKAEVYTLGTGQWRSVGRAPYRFRELVGTFLNGHAHSIVDDDQDSPEKLCAFDFDMETFKLFPSPPFEADVEESYGKSLGVLKGCLCLCVTYDSHLTVRVMKEYGIRKSWHKELVIQESVGRITIHLLCIWDTFIIDGLKDGTILMGCHAEPLFIYCPRRNIMIVDPEIISCCYKGFAFRPSFHRLQNFENETVHVF